MKNEKESKEFPEFKQYSDLQVGVTGGFGFIGTVLCRKLLLLGAHVNIFDRSNRLQFQLDELGYKNVIVIKGDICDIDLHQQFVTKSDIIFHLAGNSGAVNSNRLTKNNAKSNLQGLLSLLEICKVSKRLNRIVFPSSRLVYGGTNDLYVTEETPLIPNSIYGVHKMTAEHYLRIYAQLYDVAYSIVRISNPFGYLQPSTENHTHNIISSIMQKAIKNKRIEIYGSGEQLRDYLHVEDVVDALLLAGIVKNSKNDVFNVGMGQSIKFIEMVNKIVFYANSKSLIHHVPWPKQAEGVETGNYQVDISKIRNQLGWEPKILLDDAIKQEIAKYKIMNQIATL